MQPISMFEDIAEHADHYGEFVPAFKYYGRWHHLCHFGRQPIKDVNGRNWWADMTENTTRPVVITFDGTSETLITVGTGKWGAQ